MRQLSFASVILILILTALTSTSGVLLFLAYQGSQQALKTKSQLDHDRDAQLLQRTIDQYQSGIARLTDEIATRNDVRASLLAKDLLTIDMVLTENLHSPVGKNMDALVVVSENQKVLIEGSALLGLDLPLKQYAAKGTGNRHWDAIAFKHEGESYHFIRFQTPIVSPRLGEVIGTIYAFVMLNDNYWLLSESLTVSGASGVALFASDQLLGMVLEEPEKNRSKLLLQPQQLPIQTLSLLCNFL